MSTFLAFGWPCAVHLDWPQKLGDFVWRRPSHPVQADPLQGLVQTAQALIGGVWTTPASDLLVRRARRHAWPPTSLPLLPRIKRHRPVIAAQYNQGQKSEPVDFPSPQLCFTVVHVNAPPYG